MQKNSAAHILLFLHIDWRDLKQGCNQLSTKNIVPQFHRKFGLIPKEKSLLLHKAAWILLNRCKFYALLTFSKHIFLNYVPRLKMSHIILQTTLELTHVAELSGTSSNVAKCAHARIVVAFHVAAKKSSTERQGLDQRDIGDKLRAISRTSLLRFGLDGHQQCPG